MFILRGVALALNFIIFGSERKNVQRNGKRPSNAPQFNALTSLLISTDIIFITFQRNMYTICSYTDHYSPCTVHTNVYNQQQRSHSDAVCTCAVDFIVVSSFFCVSTSICNVIVSVGKKMEYILMKLLIMAAHR